MNLGAAAASAGVAVWILGLGWLATRALSPDGGLDRRHGAVAGVLVVVGVVLWALGLRAA